MVGIILLTLLGLFLVLLGIGAIHAFCIGKKAVPLTPAPDIDEDSALQYGQHLSELLQCATVNDPAADGQETSLAFAKMRKVLEKNYPLSHQAMEQTLVNENGVLMHWKGKDPRRGAVVLMSHSDVVPAPGAWTHDPFSGAIADGRVWGRGAQDTKGSLCAIFEAAESLLAEGFTPPCDVYIVSTDNEETMGNTAPTIVQMLLDQGVRFELVSDEGGAIIANPMPGLHHYFAMLGIVEKGYANVRFTAKSKGGHASAPPKNTPLARLAAFVTEVETKNPFTVEISPPVKNMFASLAPYMSFPYRFIFGNLWLTGPLLKRVMGKISPQGGAMLQTTCAFTMAQGSTAANVIPQSASITANLRFVMHQPQKESLEIIEALAKKYDLEMDVLYAHDCSSY
ncbi:MAG: M20/M25/M40 family metallo-hydrolase, partial [Clostridiales bacterium]|nr:M20/M25/M40 family metallo-hydrolase [Clostridiales bacterium]